MGQRRERKLRFLRDNPICCFCGGRSPAAEPDHIPSRGMFIGRVAPEGYTFPACVPCNRISRDEEQVVSLLATINPEHDTPARRAHSEAKLSAIGNNFPGLLLSMFATPDDRRRALEEHGIPVTPELLSVDFPLIRLTDPRFSEAVLLFAQKLTLALHYKHTNQIIGTEGGVALRWYTNINVMQGALPENLQRILQMTPTLVRQKTSLNDQFNYQFTVSEDSARSMFLVRFPESFAFVGCGALDRA